MEKVFHTVGSTKTQALAINLASLTPKGSVILLNGVLGSGKTTFTQGFGKALGVKRAIKSPTYTIVKEYDIDDDSRLIHIDAYRLEGGDGSDIDLDQYLDGNNYILIEWSEFLADYLPSDYLQLDFEVLAAIDERRITVSAKGENKELSAVIEKLDV